MNRHFAAAFALLVVLSCAQCFGAEPLPPAPSSGWCSDSHDFFGYNGVRACPVQPPPPIPPIDPLGMNTIIGQFSSHDCTRITTNNGQDFGALFGQSEGGDPIIAKFPWRPNSIGFTIAPGKRYSAVMAVGPNPGITPRYLKGDAYGGCLRASAHFTWSIERTNVNDDPPTGRCAGSSLFGDRSYFAVVNPSNGPATDKPQQCNLRFEKNYRFWLDGEGSGSTPVIITMN